MTIQFGGNEEELKTEEFENSRQKSPWSLKDKNNEQVLIYNNISNLKWTYSLETTTL